MWLTLIVAETISASSGIGYMTMNAREFLQTDVVLLGIIIYALLGKLADVMTRAIERRALAWHPAYHSSGGKAMTIEIHAHRRLREGADSHYLRGRRRFRPLRHAGAGARATQRYRRLAGLAERRRQILWRPAGARSARLSKSRPASSSPSSGGPAAARRRIMRLIAGLDAPTAGAILIDDRPVTGLQPDVRLLFQDARLLPWQTRDRQCRHRADAGLAGRGQARPRRCRPRRPRKRLARGPFRRPAPARCLGAGACQPHRACCSSTNPSARSTR